MGPRRLERKGWEPMANHDLVSSRDGRNVRGPERWASLAGGLGLLALASRRGRPVPRLLMTLAGVMLAGRGLTGHCAVKAAMEPSAPRPGAGDRKSTRLHSSP